MSIHGYKPKGASNVSDHDAEPEEPMLAATPPAMRLVRILGNNSVLLLVIAAGAVGLTRFAYQVSTEAEKRANADEPGSGMIVRSEVRCVWLPPALVELAKRQPAEGLIRTHEDLRRLLELRGQENGWYAIIVRGHQADGEFVEIPFIRRPYSEPDVLPELLDVLDVAAGNSPGEAADKFSTTVFRLLPPSLLNRDPREAIADLLAVSGPATTAEWRFP